MLFEPAHKKHILKALTFCKSACKKTGTLQQRHCKIENNELSTADDYSSMGAPFNFGPEVELAFPDCNPSIFELESALKGLCADFYAEFAGGNLLLTCAASETLYKVSCIEDELLISCEPNMPTHSVETPGFESLLGRLGAIAGDDKSEPKYSCVRIHNNALSATNRKRFAQIFHGETLGVDGYILKEHAVAIGKKKLAIESLGNDDKHVTFHFAGGAWFKCRLWEGTVLNYAELLKSLPEPLTEPLDFSELTDKKILKTIKSIDKNAEVTFHNNEIYVKKEGLVVFNTKLECMSGYQEAFQNPLVFPLEDLMLFESELDAITFYPSFIKFHKTDFFGAVAAIV